MAIREKEAQVVHHQVRPVDDVLEITHQQWRTVSECRPRTHHTCDHSDQPHRINLTASLLANLRSRTLLLQAPQHASFTSAHFRLRPATGRLLQSLIDLPPSSNSLDFDFPGHRHHELEGLDGGHQDTSSLDQSLSLSLGQDVKSSLDYVMTKSSTDLTKIDNDILIEWLGGYEETSTHSNASNNYPSSSSYEISHDPLFSHGNDALDFFSGDDMDFKPQNDLNFLPWSENTT
ncbi:myocardin-related transcription factor B [Caerostris extrusa]|uniref:Myocardin-related transcription factor B n=1 Tax=Caerostris extrusa TaxID=172846 RepID=A0AAV4SRT9_CAEEX|nr:myocardin-related transcription factor B [Caerostris extrusa]